MRHETQSTVVELLKELGLKEYEAQAFVALTRVSHGNGLLVMVRRLLDAGLAA